MAGPKQQFRELQPATAFHESERRAIPIAICGFFVGNLLTSFGVLPAIDERFQFLSGFAVAAGLFQWIRFQRGACTLYVFGARNRNPVCVVLEIPCP